MPYLVREDLGMRFKLGDFEIIGRSADATVRLPEAGVSRQHASVQNTNGLHWFTDLASANGSYINDIAVTVPTVLRHGDRVRLGPAILVYDAGEEAAAMPPPREITLQTVVIPAQTKRLTMLVGDLRNFTTISEKLGPEQVAELLREWYGSCEQLLSSRGGIIDKFLGDGVFAYWRSDDARARACAADAARLLTMPTDTPVRRRIRDELGMDVLCHVGLHVGEVAVGGMGRGIGTIVGDAVNTAFRVESLTRKLGVSALATSAFVADWPDGRGLFRPLGSHEVKGQSQPVEVWALNA
jgi:adenylate cyclase